MAMVARLHAILGYLVDHRGMVAFVAGVVAVLGAMGMGAILIVAFGLYDTRATTPDPYPLAVAEHLTFIRSTQVEAKRIHAPRSFTAMETLAGLRDYNSSCASCHGGPGVARPRWVSGMNPTPPYVIDAARHFRPRELYWIIAHGVAKCAMPAWDGVRTRGQMWDLVAALEAMPGMTPAEYARVRNAATPPGRGGGSPEARDQS